MLLTRNTAKCNVEKNPLCKHTSGYFANFANTHRDVENLALPFNTALHPYSSIVLLLVFKWWGNIKCKYTLSALSSQPCEVLSRKHIAKKYWDVKNWYKLLRCWGNTLKTQIQCTGVVVSLPCELMPVKPITDIFLHWNANDTQHTTGTGTYQQTTGTGT